jgi:hypothetical protein
MNRLFYIVLFIFSLLSIGLNAQEITRTTVIKGKRYTAHLDLSGFYMFDSKLDTILYIQTKDFANFEFSDFNKDGYEDIFFDWGGNVRWPDFYGQ